MITGNIRLLLVVVVLSDTKEPFQRRLWSTIGAHKSIDDVVSAGNSQFGCLLLGTPEAAGHLSKLLVTLRANECNEC